MADDLPGELRALTLFLENNEQPTALFTKQQGEWKAVFVNSALRLHGKAVVPLNNALHENSTIAQCLEDDHGIQWKLTKVHDDYLAAGCKLTSLQREYAANTGVEHTEKLDWIKFEQFDQDLSQWQLFFLQHDWSNTPLGPLKAWCFELRSAVLSAMSDPAPRTIYWGPENALIYNESFAPIFGVNHPVCLGQPIEKAWRPGMREIINPYIQKAYQGKAQRIERLHIPLERNGHVEESYWDATLTPVIGTNGEAVGVQNVLVESTRAVRGERRKEATTTLGKRIASATTLEELWPLFSEGLRCESTDLPYVVFYAAEHDHSDLMSESTDGYLYTPERTICTLAATMGVLQPESLPQAFTLADETLPESTRKLANTFTSAWKVQKSILMSTEDASLPQDFAISNPDRGFGDPVSQALVIPITSISSRDLMGVLIIGTCPRVPFDDGYKMWLTILGDVLLKAAAYISLPIEQRRAQKMSDDINEALAQQLRLSALQAERSDAKFTRMGALAPIGMFVLDLEGKPLYVNDALKRLIPVLPEHQGGSFSEASSWTNRIHIEDQSRFWASWQKVTVQKIPDVCEYRVMREWREVDKATGEELSGETWLCTTSFPEVEPDGRVSSVMGWIIDVSKQKAAENVLSQKLKDALETKRQTENFMDMTSHEMRNPLSAITQSADDILTSVSAQLDTSSRQRDGNTHLLEDVVSSAQTILFCAQHQKRIMDDVLTLSKLDSSMLEIAPDRVQPPHVVKQAMSMFAAECSGAGITTTLVIEPTYDALAVDWVVLDPSRLLQVSINLLNNAIQSTKLADTREITVYVGASYERPTGKHHGICFIPVHHEKGHYMPREKWGDGEDIYIQIAVTDTGSGLDDEQMQVLFQRFAQASARTYSGYGGNGLGLFISRELCELQGGQIGVSSGKGKTTYTFYVKAKRWLPPLTGAMDTSADPVASTQGGDATQGQALSPRSGPDFDGARDSRPPLQQDKGLQTGAELLQHLHVLVVEDNLVNQKVMVKQLRAQGLTVHVANHGLEALNFINASSYSSEPTTPEQEIPSDQLPTPLSIVLLDLEMPTMDGMTCIRHIREKQLSGEILGHIPVICVTANARNEQQLDALQAGMDDVVTKPFRIQELVPKMRKLVSEKLGRA